MISRSCKRMSILLCTLMMTLMLVGCRTKYLSVETKVTETIEIHDTTITEKLVPYKESVAVRDTSSFLTNPYAYSEAKWSGGVLYHTLGINPNSCIIVKVPHYLTKTRTIQMPKIVEVEKTLNKWQQLKIDFGGYSFIGLCVAVLWLIKFNNCK